MKEKYDILDLTKVILSLMVVAIHTHLLPMALYPWLRLAVPLFFIISSFLLYTKINNSDRKMKKDIIKNYIFRLLKLYLFWFIALLPITIYVRRGWFSDGFLKGISNVILMPFLSSTFIASWYISATIWGTLIVDKLCDKFSYKLLVPIFIFFFMICCLNSGYSFVFAKLSVYKYIKPFLLVGPQGSFLVSLIYILFGKLIQENKIKLSKRLNILLIVTSGILLYLEWSLIYKLSGIYNEDCYFFLMPTSIFLFNYLRTVKINLKNPEILRKLSGFIYPLHGSVEIILNKLMSMFVSNEIISGILSFIGTCVVCILSFIVVR